jgi:hypothetical protein
VTAQKIVTTMRLRPIRIGIVPENKPGKVGLIGLPTWMWVATPRTNTIGPLTRSATAGATTVTATAKVDTITWNMGDHSQSPVTCTGAGTPYDDSYGNTDSPDCGYRYQHISHGQPNNAYTVTATSHWIVTWTAGAGQTGTINLDLTQTTQIRVGEAQALVTGN